MRKGKLEQKEKLEALAQRASADLSQAKVSAGKNSKSIMEDATVKMITLQHEITAHIEQLLDLKREILEIINQLSHISYQLVLEMRYLNGKSWDDVVSGKEGGRKC